MGRSESFFISELGRLEPSRGGPKPAVHLVRNAIFRHRRGIIEWVPFIGIAVSWACAAFGQPHLGPDPRLQRIAELPQAGMTSLRVEAIPKGAFVPPNGEQAISNLPAFFRVTATLEPSRDSAIKIEVWLPSEHWNGRLLGTGNGAGGGKIIYSTLGRALQRGFAVANTDLGTAPEADSAIGLRQRWADFGYRATHEMTVTAKAVIAAFYGMPAGHAYFLGGSTGGQQALMEAQRFPEDYDGIISIAPANNRTHLQTYFLWNWRALNEVPGETNLSAEQITAVTAAVVKASAGADGGAPGDDFLTDPRLVRFDPSQLLAPQGVPVGKHHLSPLQVNALKKIYAGPTNPRTGERIYAPLPFGSESSLLGLATQEDSSTWPSAQFYPWRWLSGAGYDYRKFDFDHDLAALDQTLAPLLNANNPDLSLFRKRGGKLMMFAGTADAAVPFQGTIEYYERVIASQGGLTTTQEFFRLFIAPGMGHGIRAGPGLNDIGQGVGIDIPQDGQHDSLYALVRWVEEKAAPEMIIATAFNGADPAKGIRFQRPIFPYPKFPHYLQGDVRSPSSFVGVDHKRGGVPATADNYLR